MSKKRVLGVIGLGHVGAHVAYSLAVQGIADELVLVDKNEQKLASEVQDLRDAAAYLPHRVTVRAGDFADLGECDVIVNSVGKIELLRETHDRLTEMDFTVPAVRSYAAKIKASGYPREISGEAVYNDICDQIEGKENGEYVVLSKFEEDVVFEYHITISDEEFNLGILTMRTPEGVFETDFDQ